MCSLQKTYASVWLTSKTKTPSSANQVQENSSESISPPLRFRMAIKTEIAHSKKKWSTEPFHGDNNNNVTVVVASSLVDRIRSDGFNYQCTLIIYILRFRSFRFECTCLK